MLYEPFGPIAGWTWGNGTLAVRSYYTDRNRRIVFRDGVVRDFDELDRAITVLLPIGA